MLRPLRLQAGPLTMLFEPKSGFLRRICLGEHEVLRGIYMAVRDRNWGTVPPVMTSLKQDIRPDAFELSFTVDSRAGDIHFCWNGQLFGSSDGTLRYVLDGEAMTTFLKNRIGFCVLHPLRECCGASACFERVDGIGGEVRFPKLIEPQIIGRSTFSNLQRLGHEISPGYWAELSFEGDVFETEDQRNWTDASFKTYCTPLALPFPVEVMAGTRLRQAVTLRLSRRERCRSVQSTPRLAVPETAVPSSAKDESSTVALAIPRQPARLMPALGLGIASHGIPLSGEEVDRLSLLHLSHLRVDLRMADADWLRALTTAITQAQQLGVGLELAVHLGLDGSESALRQCGAVLARMQVTVARVLAFRPSEPASSPATLQLARRLLALGAVPIGGGSDSHFCELNREHALGRFGLDEADFIGWPMTPQVHAFDDLSVMENLEAQPHTITSACAFAKSRALVVSPITLRPRFNAVSTGEEIVDASQLPPQVDARQSSLFNAAWTLGSIAALGATNVASLTYFETTGWRGLMEVASPSARHPLFPSSPGMVFPVYSVFDALAGFDQIAPVPQNATHPNRIASLCLFDRKGRRRLLCANLTSDPLLLKLDLGAKPARVRTLSLPLGNSSYEHRGLGWSQASQPECPSGILRLTLAPYAIASVDSA